MYIPFSSKDDPNLEQQYQTASTVVGSELKREEASRLKANRGCEIAELCLKVGPRVSLYTKLLRQCLGIENCLSAT